MYFTGPLHPANTPNFHKKLKFIMIALLKKLDSTISIEAELDIEVDSLAFRLHVERSEAILEIDRWRDALTLTKHLGGDSKSFKNMFTELDAELKRLDITVCLRNRSFAVLGPKAKPIYTSLIKYLTPVFLT